MFFEMMTLAQRNDEIAAELTELSRRTRCHLAEALEAKRDAGVVELRSDPGTVATFLFALADGVTVRRMSEPEFDIVAGDGAGDRRGPRRPDLTPARRGLRPPATRGGHNLENKAPRARACTFESAQQT